MNYKLSKVSPRSGSRTHRGWQPRTLAFAVAVSAFLLQSTYSAATVNTITGLIGKEQDALLHPQNRNRVLITHGKFKGKQGTIELWIESHKESGCGWGVKLNDGKKIRVSRSSSLENIWGSLSDQLLVEGAGNPEVNGWYSRQIPLEERKGPLTTYTQVAKTFHYAAVVKTIVNPGWMPCPRKCYLGKLAAAGNLDALTNKHQDKNCGCDHGFVEEHCFKAKNGYSIRSVLKKSEDWFTTTWECRSPRRGNAQRDILYWIEVNGAPTRPPRTGWKYTWDSASYQIKVPTMSG